MIEFSLAQTDTRHENHEKASAFVVRKIKLLIKENYERTS